MHRLLAQLVEGIQLTGNVPSDASVFLIHHGCPRTRDHCRRVATEAVRLAARFGVDESQAKVAGWLHDVSAVFPSEQRCQVARQLGVEVLPEEEAFPAILHQKISRVMATEIFGITDKAVLSAIGCHSTLRVNASDLDKVVFIADKIRWDQPGELPFLNHIQEGLEHSLDEAVLRYLDYLWQRRDSLPVVHPWLVAARRQLAASAG